MAAEISSKSHTGMQYRGQDNRCSTLEVLSLGVTFDKHRQGKLWDALRQGTAFSSIRDMDLAKVPWSLIDKDGQSGGRVNDALENAVASTPMYWGVPSMFAGLPLSDKVMKDIHGPILGLASGAEYIGLAWHLFVAADWELSETPDRLLEQAFQFFDNHPDVPLLVVSAVDTPYDHDLNRPAGATRLVRDGRYIVDLPDSAVVLVLGRRERIDRIRNFAWTDNDNDFGQNKIRKAYFALKNRLAGGDASAGRDLSVAEWLSETARLSSLEEIRTGWGTYRQRLDWEPSPWFPVPWSRSQLEAFDRLPTLGFIHRPIYIKWGEGEGGATVSKEKRQTLMKDALDVAVRLDSSDRKEFPTRIVAATAGNTDRALIMHGALHSQRNAGGPSYDASDKVKFVDIDRRLGNTGVATFFMEVAIGILGSYREGGVSAAINMRDPKGASIVFISPPSDELRAKQKHPAGGDVFRHNVEPAYDPDVYK